MQDAKYLGNPAKEQSQQQARKTAKTCGVLTGMSPQQNSAILRETPRDSWGDKGIRTDIRK
jgi:hypothetical protein